MNKYILFIWIVFNFSCQKKIQHFVKSEHSYHRFDNNIIYEDQTIKKIIEPYKTKLDKEMNVVIGELSEELVKDKPSSNLTNFAADAILFQYEKESGNNLDAVILNYGGVRLNSWARGEIKIGEIFEIMPFENNLVVMELKGNEILPLLNKIALSGGWPISEGSGFIIKDSIATDIILNKKSFNLNDTYTIGLPDYIANGGDKMEELKNLKRLDTAILLRDLIIRYVKDKKTINSNNEQRIKKF